MIAKGMDDKDNAIIEMSLKLALIYGTWKDHSKANAGFKYCIDAQEQKMKSSKSYTFANGILYNVELRFSRELCTGYLLFECRKY